MVEIGVVSESSVNFLISPVFALLSGIIIILLIFQWRVKIREYLKQRSILIEFAKTLPGPHYALPLIGNAFTFRETDKAVLTLTKISRDIKAKTFKFWLGPELKVAISDPDDLEIILLSQNAADKDDVYQLMQPGVVNGLINANGALYRAHKKLLTPAVNSTEAVNRFAHIFNYQAAILVKKLEDRAGNGEFNIHEAVSFCVADIAFETLTGESGAAQNGRPTPFLKLTVEGLHIVRHRMMRSWLYPDVIFKLTSGGRKFFKLAEEAHKYTDDEIAKRIRDYKPIHTEEERSTLPVADFLVDHMMRTGEWSVEEIRNELITLFVGLFETVEGVCCLILLMIAMHPEVQEKVREEINNTTRKDGIDGTEAANFHYLDMVIKETLRLFPVGPALPRKITGDIKLKSCTVPKGASVLMMLFTTHRDPDHWDQPEKFIPERFTSENSKNRHRFAYVPYSAGPRMCPGPKYGIACCKIIVAHMLRSYYMTTTMRLDTMRLHTHLATRCANGYNISLEKIHQ